MGDYLSKLLLIKLTIKFLNTINEQKEIKLN